MLAGKVIGNVWGTRKEERLNGLKLLVVKVNQSEQTLVAADLVGAGIGEDVLVTSGSSARIALDKPDSPIDAAIVGIIDSLEINEN